MGALPADRSRTSSSSPPVVIAPFALGAVFLVSVLRIQVGEWMGDLPAAGGGFSLPEAEPADSVGFGVDVLLPMLKVLMVVYLLEM